MSSHSSFIVCDSELGPWSLKSFSGVAIMDEEMVPQGLGHCPGFLVQGEDSHCIFHKMVSNDQEVLGVN